MVNNMAREVSVAIPNPVDFAKQVSRDRDGNYRGVSKRKKIEHLRTKGVLLPKATGAAEVNFQYERIIGDNDLKSVAWLRKAMAAASAVAKISMALPGEGEASATGFMISPLLMMTNHHVFSTAAEAADSSVYVTFGYEKSPDNRPLADAEIVSLDPTTFFLSNEQLDFAIVALARTTDRKLPGDKYGRLPLIKAPSKSAPGSAVNIIQHPDGDYKQIAFRNNLMTDAETDTIAVYLTDTNPGSSGSPVLNDDFDLVALHHSGRDFTDQNGNKIDLNGDPVTDNTPEALRYWVANEGIRISAIVGYLERRRMPAKQRALMDAAVL